MQAQQTNKLNLFHYQFIFNHFWISIKRLHKMTALAMEDQVKETLMLDEMQKCMLNQIFTSSVCSMILSKTSSFI